MCIFRKKEINRKKVDEIEEIIKETGREPDKHLTKLTIQQLKGIRILKTSIDSFNKQSALLAKLMIFIAILQVFIIVITNWVSIKIFFRNFLFK